MNIIIPLGGKGERFSKNGYTQPKPLIKIFEKTMIEYVLDNLYLLPDDKVFIIYNLALDSYHFADFIKSKYPFIHLIGIGDTKGAVETLFLGIGQILDNFRHHGNRADENSCKKSLILDCDTFYTEDVIGRFRKSGDNMVFYTKNYEANPVYSYIQLGEGCDRILEIKEKIKISDNANTGAYAFIDIQILYQYCQYVLENGITFQNEPYTSCVISEMIQAGLPFVGHELSDSQVFSLGTPSAVENYTDKIRAFLFDLDGTLVITDDIYFDVWYEILIRFHITLTQEIFKKFIQGNNDQYVLSTLLTNIDITLGDLSELKDDLFMKHIDKVIIIDGVFDFLQQIHSLGHKICIVTNCNRRVADAIVRHIHIDKFIDFIISSGDCLHGKPKSDPYCAAIEKYNISSKRCFIFEDSKTGILSGKGAHPFLLIGLETIYGATELMNMGVNLSIQKYLHLNFNDLIHFHDDGLNLGFSYRNRIKKNSLIHNIKDVLIDDNKLKGGFIADVISFKIITHDGKVLSQVLKCENTLENNLSTMAKKLDLYEREYYFYTNIATKVNVCIPTFHYLITDDDGGHTIGIVLENLHEKGFQINLNLSTESIDVTMKIIDRMARMHSLFWNKHLKALFPELKRSDDPVFRPFFNDFIGERYDLFKKTWFTIFNKKQQGLCDDIFNHFSAIQLRFSQGDHLTFIHGDIKSPNIFYDVANGHEPYFLDWQHCAIGKGVQDLAFFIIESFDIIHIHSVFQIAKFYYYKKIIEYGVTDYPFDEYEKDLRDAVYYLPFFTSIWFGTTPQDELIDKNFPYFFINKMMYLIELVSAL
jgi:HAD superfamily hydrolase (TIGR01509 family)